MGGKALNKYGVFTERKNTYEFEKIGSEIQSIVEGSSNLTISIVRCYHTKQDHGDLDVLIKIDENNKIDFKKYINETFKPRALYSNGGVYSFDYNNFQIDFITISAKNWDVANTYFSYDPLGNIMGKTFHKFNLSYGWGGLSYKFRNFNGRNSKDILISTDVKKIFEFGGFDYDRYLKGFETIEEIFEYVINSKYFNSEGFKFENLNSIDRKRNRKRGSYNEFLKYLNDNNIVKGYQFSMNKDSYIPWINDNFPEAKLVTELEILKMIDKENKIISQKFNGDLVMTWYPKLIGKELGNAMSNFKKSIENDGNDYRDFILSASFSEIHERFIDSYEENK